MSLVAPTCKFFSCKTNGRSLSGITCIIDFLIVCNFAKVKFYLIYMLSENYPIFIILIIKPKA